MALIRCSKCSRLFADKKTICPHCDTPVDYTAVESKQREELKYIEVKQQQKEVQPPSILSIVLYSAGIIIVILILVQTASQYVKLEEKKVKSEKFKSEKNNILKQVQLQMHNKTYKEISYICNEYADLNDEDLSTLCSQAIKEEREERKEERKRLAAQESAEREADIKTYLGPKAWKIYKKYPHWSPDDCIRVSRGEYWIGMSRTMMVASLGKPNSAKPSNYGAGEQWQYCYTGFQCFYDSNGDDIIDSYN